MIRTLITFVMLIVFTTPAFADDSVTPSMPTNTEAAAPNAAFAPGIVYEGALATPGFPDTQIRVTIISIDDASQTAQVKYEWALPESKGEGLNEATILPDGSLTFGGVNRPKFTFAPQPDGTLLAERTAAQGIRSNGTLTRVTVAAAS